MPAASPGGRHPGPAVLGPVGRLALGAGAVVLLWHLAVVVGGALSGARSRPTLEESVQAVLRSPTNPLSGYPGGGLAPGWLVWSLFLVELAGVVAAVWWWMARAMRGSRREGMATRRQLAPFLGEAAARRLARQTCPTLTAQERKKAPIERVAVPLGRVEGSRDRLYASHEDSFAVIGAPRSYKTSAILMDAIRTAPGPVVAASTKGELLAVTYLARSRVGQVHVFDPADVVGWPARLRWSPVTGCEDPEVAMSRAEGVAAAIPKDQNTTNSQFFEDQARDVLRCLLHAAALTGATLREVIGWAHRLDSPTLPAREILRTHPGAAVGWSIELESLTSGDLDGPVDSTKKTLARLLAAFASPKVLESCSPAEGEAFDIERFVRSRDTIYVMSGEGSTVAPLVTAFVSEVVRVARRESQRGVIRADSAERTIVRRLDPALRCVIDEVANVCPLPGLPELMSESGGRGITVWIGSHGLGQARKRWTADGAQEVFGSATAKLVMGGTSEADFLENMSRLAGEIEVMTTSTTMTRSGESSSTAGYRDRRIIRLHEIRELPPATALVMYRQAPPVVATFQPYWESPWAAEAAESEAEVARIINSDGGPARRPKR
ncbi:MAG: type IV secretory system conjugative DNA transfer family protein [Micromonosporaceae bacterium]|nr:type IV secretory system conjugative DNA transfer family protein [Micromonosporaceae bacterium]